MGMPQSLPLGKVKANLVNCTQVADLNKPEEAFEFVSESFDFVNSRFVAGGLAQARWPSYITDIRR